jgi:hypothetical protein
MLATVNFTVVSNPQGQDHHVRSLLSLVKRMGAEAVHLGDANAGVSAKS